MEREILIHHCPAGYNLYVSINIDKPVKFARIPPPTTLTSLLAVYTIQAPCAQISTCEDELHCRSTSYLFSIFTSQSEPLHAPDLVPEKPLERLIRNFVLIAPEKICFLILKYLDN